MWKSLRCWALEFLSYWLLRSVVLIWFLIRETENKDKLLSEVQEVHYVARERNTCCLLRLTKAFAIRISMIFTFFKPPLEMRSNQSKDQICPPQIRKVVFTQKLVAANSWLPWEDHAVKCQYVLNLGLPHLRLTSGGNNFETNFRKLSRRGD